MFTLLVASFSLAGVSSASAQDWAKAKLDQSPRHREYVAIKDHGRSVTTFVVYPEVKDKAPVVVLIHEIFGLSDWMKLQADELAARGYIVLAPDLLSGWGPAATAARGGVPASTADAHAIAVPQGMYVQGSQNYGPPNSASTMADGSRPNFNTGPVATPSGGAAAPAGGMQMGGQGAPAVAMNPGGTSAFPDQDAVVRAVLGLDAEEVIADLNAVASYGKSLPSANGKLAVAGFCWGGGKSFDFATHRKDLSVAFVFYGPEPKASELKKIAAPVYGFYAGNDARISAGVPQTTADMKAAGKTYEPVIYDGAGHGFMRAGQAPGATAANQKAFEEAFSRLTTELDKLK